MTFSNQLHLALTLAVVHHAEQVDKRNVPFILHVLRVGLAGGDNEDEVIVGILHDLVEDTPVTLETLQSYGFPTHIIDAVGALTRCTDEPYNETYWQYIDRLIQNPLATKVKLHDLNDNLSPGRQDFEGAAGLAERHRRARILVREAAERHSYEAALGPRLAHKINCTWREGGPFCDCSRNPFK